MYSWAISHDVLSLLTLSGDSEVIEYLSSLYNMGESSHVIDIQPLEFVEALKMDGITESPNLWSGEFLYRFLKRF